MCGDQYTGSTKTKFRSRANNYESTQRKFINKEALPKQDLKQKLYKNAQVKLNMLKWAKLFVKYVYIIKLFIKLDDVSIFYEKLRSF